MWFKGVGVVITGCIHFISGCDDFLVSDKGKAEVFKKTGSEIGKQAAAKSGGLFSAEDWQCSM